MTVRTEQQDHVTTVIIDRIDARNDVDHSTADLLTEAFLAFDADPEARVRYSGVLAGRSARATISNTRRRSPIRTRSDASSRRAWIFRPRASSRAARWVRRASRCRSP